MYRARSCEPVPSDRGHARRVHEQRQAAEDGKTKNEQVEPPAVGGIDCHVGIAEVSLDVPGGDRAAGFLEDLPPGAHQSPVPSVDATSLSASRPVVPVRVDGTPAPFARDAVDADGKPSSLDGCYVDLDWEVAAMQREDLFSRRALLALDHAHVLIGGIWFAW